jgi:hypothetical protein
MATITAHWNNFCKISGIPNDTPRTIAQSAIGSGVLTGILTKSVGAGIAMAGIAAAASLIHSLVLALLHKICKVNRIHWCARAVIIAVNVCLATPLILSFPAYRTHLLVSCLLSVGISLLEHPPGFGEMNKNSTYLFI